MKIKTILTALLLTAASYSQNVYEVIPGTKENQIKLIISNISETNSLENVNIHLPNSF